MVLASVESAKLPLTVSLEDKACDYIQSYANFIARRHYDPYKWRMDYEEIVGEMLLYGAIVIDKYLRVKSPKPWVEFTALTRTAMWNRIKTVKGQVYGTYRKVEFNAHVIPEDFKVGYYDDSLGAVLFLWELMSDLSPTACQIVRAVLDPDERMQRAIMDHVEHRNSQYINGAGVNGIPVKVIVKGTGIDVFIVKQARTEIITRLKDKENIMASPALPVVWEEDGKKINFTEDYVTWQDYGYMYSRWTKPFLVAQTQQRGIHEEGMSRREMVDALRDHDEEKGVPDDREANLLPSGGITPAKPKAKVEEVVKEPDVDEDDEFDTKFLGGEPIDDGESEDDEDTDFGLPPLPAKPTERVVAKPKLQKSEEKSTSVEEPEEDTGSSVTGTYKISDEQVAALLTGVVEALRQGEELTLRRAGSNEWNIHLASGKVVAAKPEVEKVPEKEKKQRKKSSKDGKKLSSEYVAFKAWVDEEGTEAMIAAAVAEGVTWNESEDSTINHMRVFMALRKHRKIEKWA